jgi:peptidyl-prolyl cis-trans isomerase C
MRLKKFVTTFVCAVLPLTLGACHPGKTAEAAAKEPVAATVNGTPITAKMVDLIAKRGASAGRPDTPQARATIIDQLALQVVLADEAIKKGLDKSPEVAEQVAALKQSVLANAYVEDYLKSNPVSDAQVQEAYDRIKATITGDEYRIGHIVVEKESEAKDIIAKLNKDPSAFAKLAAERSKDQGSKDKGGDLGWFDASKMPSEFAPVVSGLEKGKITQQPVKTDFGYHVVLLEDSKPIEAPPLDEVKEQLTQQLQQQNVKKQLDALKAAAKIQVADATGAETPAPAAGN